MSMVIERYLAPAQLIAGRTACCNHLELDRVDSTGYDSGCTRYLRLTPRAPILSTHTLRPTYLPPLVVTEADQRGGSGADQTASPGVNGPSPLDNVLLRRREYPCE